jgi:hypothetical protein
MKRALPLALALLLAACGGHDAGKTAAVPYRWKSVQIVGGGFVDGFIFHPTEPDLRYARTDMGGAYRWDQGKDQWDPILDWVPYKDLNLMGHLYQSEDARRRDPALDGSRQKLRADRRALQVRRQREWPRQWRAAGGRPRGRQRAVPRHAP